MTIRTLPVGLLETNCYIVENEDTAVVIDPGSEPEKILQALSDKIPAAILLTHGHFDHIGGVAELAEKTGAKIYIHENDVPMITDPRKSLSFMTGEIPRPFKPDVLVNDGDELNFGGLRFLVLHTPGHSAGGVSYSIENALFGGDLIFRASVGRFDYGNYADEMNSVRRVLSCFPPETVIYPGHGPKTTVDYENKHNPYVGSQAND